MEEKELLSEEMLEKIMMGVAIAGTAKSLGKEALNQANQGDFQKAREFRNPTRSSISSAVSAPPQGCSPRATFRVTWCCCRSNPQAIRLPPSRLRPRSPIP